MSAYHRQASARDMQHRVALLKSKVGFDDAVVALGMEGDAGPECPSCGALDALKPCHKGNGYFCEVCAETGDVITLVRARRDCGHLKAVEFLERECLSCKDSRTLELF